MPQGNCADSDPVATLNLSAADAADLIPLKPFQCLIIVDETWLFVNDGAVWVDNLYLKLLRRNHWLPNISFITAGLNIGPLAASTTDGKPQAAAQSGLNRSDAFVTNVTFQGEHHGTAVTAVSATVKYVSVYIDGVLRCQLSTYPYWRCHFRTWAGRLSRLRETLGQCPNNFRLTLSTICSSGGSIPLLILSIIYANTKLLSTHSSTIGCVC